MLPAVPLATPPLLCRPRGLQLTRRGRAVRVSARARLVCGSGQCATAGLAFGPAAKHAGRGGAGAWMEQQQLIDHLWCKGGLEGSGFDGGPSVATCLLRFLSLQYQTQSAG